MLIANMDMNFENIVTKVVQIVHEVAHMTEILDRVKLLQIL